MRRHAVEGVVGDVPQVAAPQLQLGQHGEEVEVGGLEAPDSEGVAAETQLVEVSEGMSSCPILHVIDLDLSTLQFLRSPPFPFSSFLVRSASANKIFR